MKMTQLKSPTKAEIEAANYRKMEKEIKIDIRKIEELVQGSEVTKTKVEELHRYLDGKYQNAIADWGKSMYGFTDGVGFNYESLSVDSLKDNLKMMKPKLEAFRHGWNTKGQSSRASTHVMPDVNVTVNNSVNINITFEQVRSKLEDMTSLTEEETNEALEKVSEIEAIVNSKESKKAKWEKMRPVLSWLADRSFDMAMTIIPLLLKIQG